MAFIRFCRNHPLATALAAYAAFLLALGFVNGWAASFISQKVSILGYILFCAATGIMEEGIFCLVVFSLLVIYFGKDVSGRASSMIRPMAMTAILFGLAHASFASGVALGAAKILQASLFGFCMVSLFAKTKNIACPMIAHTAFDAVYFLPGYIHSGILPISASASSLDGNLGVLLITTCVLSAISAVIVIRLRKADLRGVEAKRRGRKADQRGLET